VHAPAASLPRLSLVVSTVGRLEPFVRLVRSIERATRRDEVELVLVDQSRDRRCAAWLEDSRTALRWRSTSSGPGVSVGRNAGLLLTTGAIIGFPDDDCWYEPDTLELVLGQFDGDHQLDALAGRALTADGRPSMLRWPDRPAPITPSNYYRTSIAFTLFVRGRALAEVGGFDVSIGAGAPGWYGAGEESDLVLRLLAQGHVARYDPEVIVHHHEPQDHPGPDLTAKMLRYGCGQGHLWRVHDVPAGHVVYRLGRKLTGAVTRCCTGHWRRGLADLAFVRGCVAGMRGRRPRQALRPAEAA
jgi:glycosyltransferase involved in cell wall biosynthesis